MNDFLATVNAALAEVTDYLGSSFVYAGHTYNAVINDLELSNDLKDGGLLESLSTIIIVSKDVLQVEPKAGETLYIGPRKARIIRVKIDEISYELHCETAKK